MTGFASPDLHDGVEASSIECDKNQDGTLDCQVFTGDYPRNARSVEEVRISDNVDRRSRHFGPQDEPHIEVIFSGYGGPNCHLGDERGVLECTDR